MNRTIWALFIFLLWLALALCSAAAVAQKTYFQDGENRLEAVYLLPSHPEDHKGIVLFVHGDGPLDYEAAGYYPLIWDILRKQGFAIFSWSKPGVGGSSGQWLDQSMLDRQTEVKAAIKFVRNRYQYSGEQTGLLGFSQAGWVVPAVAQGNPEVGFVIGIGFAMDWQTQSWYLTKTRLAAEGKTSAEIEHSYAEHIQEIIRLKQNIGYERYRNDNRKAPDRMSEARFAFVKRNLSANASNDYKNLSQPMLILLGEHDLNVDINATKSSLASIFRYRNNAQVTIIPKASHGLLKAEVFRQQVPGILFWLKLMWTGESALAVGFPPVLNAWIAQLETIQHAKNKYSCDPVSYLQ
ncbi:MAG: pimeloyl-ACP methyl ester carboxylesterase [Candidatus Pseudothioglobus sp.]|jgi:pimeloyl-ACP methyl ester carboxylesterase